MTEAVRNLQLNKLKIAHKKIKELTIRNENNERDNLLLDQQIAKLKDYQIEQISKITGNYVDKIEKLENAIAERDELIKKNIDDEKEKLMSTKKIYEERIEKLDIVKTAKEVEMKKAHKEEIEMITAEHEKKNKKN